MKRNIQSQVTGYRTKDGAGVSLVRVLGRETVREFDPILMLDSFDSTNPADYIAGFPLHPHRGIETVSYLARGKMVHMDTLGNEDAIEDGEVQWMNAGSGIEHAEKLPASERLLGAQLWLNLPASDKMSHPTYHSIKRHEIEEIAIDGGMLRLLAGNYGTHKGHEGDHLPLDYYDVHLEAGKTFSIETARDDFVMLFTLLGEITIEGETVAEKTAVKLTEGESLAFTAGADGAQVLYICSRRLGEPVAWAGPIVMNTEEELREAFRDLERGTFLKEKIDYEEA